MRGDLGIKPATALDHFGRDFTHYARNASEGRNNRQQLARKSLTPA
jgi:hypothetical protein